MKIWNNMKVKTKLLTLIGGLCITLTAVGVTGLVNLQRLSAALAEANHGMQHISLLSEMKSNFMRMRLDLLYVITVNDSGQMIEKSEDFAKRAQLITAALDKLRNTELTQQETDQLWIYESGFVEYAQLGSKLMEASMNAADSGDADGRQRALDEVILRVAPLYQKPGDAIDSLVEAEVKGSRTFYEENVREYRMLVLSMVIVLGVCISLAVIAGLAVARSINNPLQRVLKALLDVAGGDLTVRVNVDSRDEMGMLAGEVNAMAAKLNSIMNRVAANTTHVASAATELYSTSEQMATGAEEVAAQAGTVATAGEEMAATSTEIAHNCMNAFHCSEQASASATSGSAIVRETLDVMNKIAVQVTQSAKTIETLGSRSEQIGEIVEVIEDIADQTNLLALNAAIEAARAGEQGRGFAVVADEVRALAERTAKATKEISAMIKAIQQETKQAVSVMQNGVREVEKGTREAGRSGEALEGILEKINSVSQQVSQIATAAEQQTATTTEISNNMQQITSVIDETAKGAQQSALAASQLAKLSDELQRIVAEFKLVS